LSCNILLHFILAHPCIVSKHLSWLSLPSCTLITGILAVNLRTAHRVWDGICKWFEEKMVNIKQISNALFVDIHSHKTKCGFVLKFWWAHQMGFHLEVAFRHKLWGLEQFSSCSSQSAQLNLNWSQVYKGRMLKLWSRKAHKIDVQQMESSTLYSWVQFLAKPHQLQGMVKYKEVFNCRF